VETLLYIAVWAAIIFFMMRFGCGAHVMGHGHGGHGSSTNSASKSTAARWVPPEKDTDPVCGMTVATKDAKSAVCDGTVYYFCSSACRDKFESSPTSYLGGGDPSQHPEHHHG
jgi:YHS domain-containing protein